MTVTVSELIEYLQEFADNNPDMEVRLATQPSYPFECEVCGVTTNEEMVEENEEEVCYILQGMQIGYTSKKLWNNLA